MYFSALMLPIIEKVLIYLQGIKLRHLKYLSNMLALCWCNTLAYYAFCCAGMFSCLKYRNTIEIFL